ncbi:MAG: fibronectin type III domain-containing protein [Candidatus Pacebacteria bacterium]|nr:fibronectin type III domain-containing protein [Candidatus Paceibacterota bacterium]
MKINFTKNRIIIGCLAIAVCWAGFLLPGNAKAVVPLNVQFEKTPLFSEANFVPGGSVERWVKATNNSGQIQRIAVEAINKNDPDNFGEKLNLTIKEGETVIFNNTLKQFLDQGETYLSSLANNANTRYDFSVSFNSDANDFYQGKTLGFDIIVGFEGTEGGLPLPSPGGGTRGGGVVLPPGLTISYETYLDIQDTSVTITWFTSYQSTSHIIYAPESGNHTINLSDNSGTPPKYGYDYTTPEYDISPKVTFHSVSISGLTPSTRYYYRAVSHGSLAIGQEYSFITKITGENNSTSGNIANSQEHGEEENLSGISGAGAENAPLSGMVRERQVSGGNNNSTGTGSTSSSGNSNSNGTSANELPQQQEQTLTNNQPRNAFLASIGLFPADWIVLLVLALIIIIFLIFAYRKKKKKKQNQPSTNTNPIH